MSTESSTLIAMSTSDVLNAMFHLNDGGKLPPVGLGTFQGDQDNSMVEEIVFSAIQKGYRHIDAATAYGNEKEIGRAIRRSAIPRSELFVTTKL